MIVIHHLKTRPCMMSKNSFLWSQECTFMRQTILRLLIQNSGIHPAAGACKKTIMALISRNVNYHSVMVRHQSNYSHRNRGENFMSKSQRGQQHLYLHQGYSGPKIIKFILLGTVVNSKS